MEQVENLGWCIVQEYIDGDTLQTITQKQLEQLCDALIYIHHLGITHRDLKPENILVTNNTNDIVLLDFGLADKADFTVLKSAAGTTGYIAPEQLAEGIINPQVDIFALGVILSKQKQWKRIAKKCLLANPQKRYLSVDEIKHTIKQKSPWISRGIAIVLIICAVIIGLSLQLYHQQLSLTHQQQVVIDLDSNNIVLTEQILDYQRQVDSLKNDLYSANQRVDLSQNEIIKKLSDIESIQKTITTENLDPSTQALLKQYQQEVIWLQTQLEEANQRYNVLWEKYEEEEYKERVKSQR
jgi:serine/threonine protein kinase